MGWDTSARLFAIVRFRGGGDLDAVFDALVRGGITLVEVTIDTPGALPAVERAAEVGRPVGVGTVRSRDQVRACADAGAAFVVSPGLFPDVVEEAGEVGIDLVPGALTPTEIGAAARAGAAAVKLFPASLGGPAYVRAIRGPFPDVPLAPTGGIRVDDVGAFLSAGATSVGLGGELVGRAPPSDDAELGWIEDAAARALRAAGATR